MPRPLFVTIDISAMKHNLARAKASVPHAKVWGVVKANAYGHGLARGMRGLAAADGLALVELHDAVRLREMGWRKPILLLEGFFSPGDLAIVAQYQLDSCIHCIEQIDMLERADVKLSLNAHLKMNTGMNRLGFVPDKYRAAYARLRAIPALRQIVLMTHFANADEDKHHRLQVGEQVRRFQEGAEGLPGERSLSNSAGTLLYPQLGSDWVRPGIMLYGASPGGKTAEQFGLLPAMTLRSEIIGVQAIEKGESVGYGSRFQASAPMKIGVLACGYADGYPRHATDGAPVLVDGCKTHIVGRVSMGLIGVDLTPVPGAGVGSQVTLWGEGLPIDDVAGAAGTIGYELMCALATRVRVVEVGA